MPKIRDLGINVIPDMTRPPEIGYGGCGCTLQTFQQGCGATDPCSAQMMMMQPCPAASNVTCVDTGAFYDARTCGATRVTCSDYGMYTCGATRVPCSNQFPCYGLSHCTPTPPNCTPSPKQPSDFTCFPSPGGLTREAIAQLKAQLQQQIEQLEEYAKHIGPKTAEEIDAREKELKAELEELARRRQDLGK